MLNYVTCRVKLRLGNAHMLWFCLVNLCIIVKLQFSLTCPCFITLNARTHYLMMLLNVYLFKDGPMWICKQRTQLAHVSEYQHLFQSISIVLLDIILKWYYLDIFQHLFYQYLTVIAVFQGEIILLNLFRVLNLNNKTIRFSISSPFFFL